MPRLSIIIPVYKVEKYIRECLDSILNQTFTDFEVLLIDDGSPDNSGDICDEYSKKDSRFKVFHKENGGVSSARNLGIDNAKGDWVHFIDPDDYLMSDSVYSEIFAAESIKNVDIVHFGFLWKFNDVPDIRGNNDGTGGLKSFIDRNVSFLWCNLIYREIIGDTRFEKMAFGEDALFMEEIAMKKASFLFIDKVYYFYRLHPESAIGGNKYLPTYFEDCYKLTNRQIFLRKQENLYDEQVFGWKVLDRFFLGVMNEANRNEINKSVKTLMKYSKKFNINELIDKRTLKFAMSYNKYWFFVRYGLFRTFLILQKAKNIMR